MKRTSAGLFLLCCCVISACNGNGKILSVEADFWLIIAVLLFLKSLLLLIVLVRVRKKLRRRIRRQSEELRDARQLMNELQRQCTSLQDEKEERDFFFSMVVHDLKSPLRFLMMRARQLADEAANEQLNISQESISDLWVEATAVYHLALDMLLLQEIKTLEELPQAQRMDMGALMKDVVELYSKIVSSKGNQLEMKVAQGLELLVPYELIKVVVRNLIDNANKFTSNGNILVIALLHEKHLSIVVEDTGIGMDERQLHMLMNASPGNRVSIARTFGIGYTVIHTLLEKMKGKLSIVSTPGKGTRVTVRIPVQVSSIW